MQKQQLTDADLADGLRDLAAALDGEAQMGVVGWWRADRLLERAKARTQEVLGVAIEALETKDEKWERFDSEMERNIAHWGNPTRGIRIKRAAA